MEISCQSIGEVMCSSVRSSTSRKSWGRLPITSSSGVLTAVSARFGQGVAEPSGICFTSGATQKRFHEGVKNAMSATLAAGRRQWCDNIHSRTADRVASSLPVCWAG
eukprot:1762134-Amphidinium_carterae.1